MGAATAEFDSPTVQGQTLRVTVPASTVIYAGTMVCLNTNTGAVAKATDAANLKVIGRAEKNGVAGDVIPIHCGFAHYKISESSALAAADFGDVCYVEDDTTVAKASANSARAGVFKGLRVLDGVTYALVDHANNF